jgi:hypothetical protein
LTALRIHEGMEMCESCAFKLGLRNDVSDVDYRAGGAITTRSGFCVDCGECTDLYVYSQAQQTHRER